MYHLLKGKTELERLQKQYSKMMKNAYELALKDKTKSDDLHEKASKILIEIKKIEHQA
ncbi:Lacal_2735 family protein [Aquimarina sp. RZ0]|uniref:Lacal_2735 family protein n=1 Tax=Aquimarina sp. RZ0 TaxID=2607730 RepID=UPI0011F271D9|nr:Lacal_2735 family protein [Aquimarina sp. RZ0]KAA1246050.1 Lacal_2735 family protein [Aquimarina sp. RZ0]